MIRSLRLRTGGILALAFAAGCGGSRSRNQADRPTDVLPEFMVEAQPSAPVQPVRLTAFTSSAVYGRLDPKGQRLVYSSDQKGTFDIWIRDLRTGAPVRVTEHPARDTMPAWSPDGKRIVFVSMRDDVKGDLYLSSGGEVDDEDRLTGRKAGERFPTFSPDGDSIYFERGPAGQGQIVRLDLDLVGKKKNLDDPVAETVVTEVGASQPAISPDGTLLAFTFFAPGEPARIAIMPILPPAEGVKGATITYGPMQVVTTGPYHCGFPTFTSDGTALVFTRFHKGPPQPVLSIDAEGSLWSIPVARLQQGPEAAMAAAEQLAPDDGVVVAAQGHPAGLVYSAGHGGRFDLWLIPERGTLPAQVGADALIAQAAALDDEHGRAYLLSRLAGLPPTAATQAGLYEAITALRRAGELEKAATLAEQLAAQPAQGPHPDKVRCDAALLPLETRLARDAAHKVERAAYDAAEAALEQAARAVSQPAARAHCAMRRADLALLRGAPAQAADLYRGVIREHAAEKAVAARAHVRLGAILEDVGTDEGPAAFYLAAFGRWPGETETLRDAATRAVAFTIGHDHTGAPERLRTLIEHHAADKPLFAAIALNGLGALYAERGDHALAARTYGEVIEHHPEVLPEAALAAFEAADHAHALAEEARRAGRYNEASRFYDQALATLRRVVERFRPPHRFHQRAHDAFVQLSLQRAHQAERDGDLAKAYQLHRELAELDDRVLQAHRKIIEIDLARDVPPPLGESADPAEIKARRKEIAKQIDANWDALVGAYEARLDADSQDPVANYALGYLHTLAPNLGKGDLKKAEKYLLAASNRDPRSPFPYMTLGWVYLTREEVFGDISENWVGWAIDAFEKAYHLNDRRADLQTEGDLLLNLGNAYGALGNGWKQAIRAYREREALEALGLRWLNPERQAMFHASFGRAAFKVDAYDDAVVHYEAALGIARRRMAEVDPELAGGYRAFEAQIISQLALLYHFTGDLDSSNRYFEWVQGRYREQGQLHLLAGLERSIAYNLLLQGRSLEAFDRLQVAAATLKEHGGRKIGDYTRIPITTEDSLFPLGFDTDGERHVQTALLQLIYRDSRAAFEAARFNQQALVQREKLFKKTQWPDMARAVWPLKGRAGLDALAAGDWETFEELTDDVLEQAASMQIDDTQAKDLQFSGRPEMFSVMAQAVTNLSVALIRAGQEGRYVDPQRLARQAQRIRQLEGWRQRLEGREGKNLIPDEATRVEYLNANALALLAFVRQKATDPNPKVPLTRGGKLADYDLLTWCFGESVALLRAAVARTAPKRDERAWPAPDYGATPMHVRLGWHVESLLNLSELASYFTPPRARDDRGREILAQARAICHPPEPPAEGEPPPDPPPPVAVPLDLGPACLLADMAHADRTGDLALAEQVVAEYVGTYPALLGEAYLTRAAAVRDRLFAPTLRLAAEAKQYQRVFELAELRDRRAVVEELVAFGFDAPEPKLARALRSIDQWVAYHRRAVAHQTLRASALAEHQDAITAIRKARDPEVWRRVFERVAMESPDVRGLLDAEPFDYGDVGKALGPGASILSAVVAGDQVVLFNVRPGELRHHVVKAPASRVIEAGSHGEQNLDVIAGLFGEEPRRWLSGDQVVYFDLLRLGDDFPAEVVAAHYAPEARKVMLTGAQTLADAYRHRNLHGGPGLMLPPLPEEKGLTTLQPKHLEKLATLLPGWRAMNPEELARPQDTRLAVQHTGLQLWARPVRVEIDSLANVALSLRGPAEGLHDLRFPHRLGEQVHASLVVMPDAVLGPRTRDALLMVSRYVHAAGVPTFVIGSAQTLDDDDLVDWFAAFAPALEDQPAADAWAATAVPEAKRKIVEGPDEDAQGRNIERKHRLRLMGFAGLSPKIDAAEAANQLDKLQEAATHAEESGLARKSVTLLEFALGIIGRTPDVPDREARLDHVREHLAKGYVALSDYSNAVKVQKLLLETRRAQYEARRRTEQRKALFEAWVVLPGWLARAPDHGNQAALEESARVRGWLAEVRAEVPRRDRAWLETGVGDLNAIDADIHERAGRFTEAADAFEAAAKAARARLEEGDTDAALTLAVQSARAARIIRLELDDTARAQRLYDDAMAHVPEADLAAYEQGMARRKAAAERLLTTRGEEGKAAREALHAIDDELAPLRRRAETRATVLLELGRIRRLRGDPSGAAQLLREAQQLVAAADDRALLRTVKIEATLAAAAVGSPQRALELAEEGLRDADLDASTQVRLLVARGQARAALGRHDAARADLEAALDVAEKANHPRATTFALRALGRFELADRRFAAAQGAFSRAAALNGEAGRPDLRASDEVLIGTALRLQGRRAEALTALEAALASAAERTGRRATEAAAEAWLEIGRLRATGGRDAAPAALEAFEQGLQAETRLADEAIRWRLLLGAGRALHVIGRIDEADKHLTAAVDIVERLPATLRPGPTALRLDEQISEVYDEIISLRIDQGRAEEAFDLSERQRARGFIDLVGTAEVPLPKSLKAVEQLYRAYATALDTLRAAEASYGEAAPSDRAQLAAAREAARTAAEDARRALEAKDVELPAYLAVRAAPYAELKALIPEGQAIVSWYPLDDRLLIFVARRDGLSVKATDVTRDRLLADVRLYRDEAINFHSLQSAGRRLYDLLLAPVADALPERIAVVPAGPLHVVPVAGLWDGKRWAVERWTVSYLPTANHLRFLQKVGPLRPRRATAFTWAGMGPETQPPPGTKRYLRRLEEWQRLSEQWPGLPFATKETESFQETFGAARVHHGDTATVERFLAEAGEADLLHVATHAVHDESNPLLSFLQFGGRARNAKGEPELFPDFDRQRLSFFDVLGLRLSADLVSLSACETGLGDPAAGDGVVGLHRAFLTAGARSVVSSLWRVSDLSSGVLMKNFHRSLRTQDPAAALRAAQLRVMQHWPHPAYWAGFRLEGVMDTSPAAVSAR